MRKTRQLKQASIVTVVRHQPVKEIASRGFGSRRLHHVQSIQ